MTAYRDLCAVEATAPHPIYAPDLPRHIARCACGWASIPSLFRAMVMADFDRHAAAEHGLPMPSRASDSLAACFAEVRAA